MNDYNRMEIYKLHRHIVVAGDPELCMKEALETALTVHSTAYVNDTRRRTRITIVCDSITVIRDFVFEYQELFDNSYWRIIDLSGIQPVNEQHRPQYEGVRKDFVDVEWEFVIGHISHPVLSEKLRRWANDCEQQLTVSFNYNDPVKGRRLADKMRHRLPERVEIKINEHDPEIEAKRMAETMQMAKYLHFIYHTVYELKHVPTELPEDEVDKAWDILDDKMKISNVCNVMSIPIKMELLGHDRKDWDKFYALTSDEIEQLTAVEHNRWSVERLIHGWRPCTDQERKEIAEDMSRRLSDPEYAAANPVSLKKKYKTERNAHYDLCAYCELGVDESGLPVTRYDRDLTAAIPLIAKTYNDRHKNG